MKIYKKRDVETPQRGTPGSAGIDFFIPNDAGNLILNPGERANIPSGIHAEIPVGFALIAFNKSGVCTRKGIIVGADVIDYDYQGEIHLHVINTGSEAQLLKPGDKLIQFILLPVNFEDIEKVRSLEDLFPEKSERGEKGFGSTGG